MTRSGTDEESTSCVSEASHHGQTLPHRSRIPDRVGLTRSTSAHPGISHRADRLEPFLVRESTVNEFGAGPDSNVGWGFGYLVDNQTPSQKEKKTEQPEQQDADRLHPQHGDAAASECSVSTGASTTRSCPSGPSSIYGQNNVTDPGCMSDDKLSFLSIDEFLELDPRPTFVLDLDAGEDDIFTAILLNRSLRSDLQLLKDIESLSLSTNWAPEKPHFKTWITQLMSRDNTPATFSYNGIKWTGCIVRHWLIVGGHRDESSSTKRHSVHGSRTRGPMRTRSQDGQQPKRALTSPDENILLDSQYKPPVITFDSSGTTDWTVEEPQGELSEYIKFARDRDWASTALGALSTWSPELRQLACLVMGNPLPVALFWGDELTMMYNEAYSRTVGNKHPALMATRIAGPFAETWGLLDPIFTMCAETGKPFSVHDQLVPLERHGFIEEMFYTWSLTPLYGGTDTLKGFYASVCEATANVRSGRALKTLLRLGQELAMVQSIPQFWPKILSTLSDNAVDFPFAILYSVFDESEAGTTCSDSCQGMLSCIMEGDSTCSDSNVSITSCVLEGTLGASESHPAVPKRMDLNRSSNVLANAFRDAMHSDEVKLLSVADGSFPKSLLECINWLGYEEPCREALVVPIRPMHSTVGDSVQGFLLVGVNPRRHFDSDYQAFIRLLDRQIATSLAAVTGLQSEIERNRNAAEVARLERVRLSEELAVQRSRLQRVAEVSLVAMFSIDPAGVLLEANNRWFEMTGHSRTIIYAKSWLEVVHESSLELVEDIWTSITVDHLPWSGEVRLKNHWGDDMIDEEIDCWVLTSCQPEFDSNGKLRSIMGSMTNISRTKWAEALQLRRLQEADENRRAQNNFIDITSHEMRNPLSAILQCADGISTSLTDIIEAPHSFNKNKLTIIKECISGAETIQLCAQHQKAIVDDILTISKLDSNLLLITPVPVQPVEIVRQALQMFTIECQKMHDIQLGFHIEKSFVDLRVDTVMLDSSRLIQVLINLLTNAIKFTKSREERKIHVFVAAYLEPPVVLDTKFQYFPSPNKKCKEDVTNTPEWGDGEVVYLRFEVKDSGCGLNDDEKKKLFNRFSQASPRTHVQYGGSGLGLFISRQLTELQGGEIGVASEAGVGSTFAFYVKSRRTGAQEDPEIARKRASWEAKSNSRQVTDNFEAQSTFGSVGTETTEQEVIPAPIMLVGPSEWHVLIVEDNVVNQRILAQQIRKLGSTVYVANHGGEALEIIQQSKHHVGHELDGKELSVILMDLEMPIMDGLTCVRKIREMEAEGLIHGHLPIIAVTANARGEQIATAKDSGMDDVMCKPFRIVQIKSKIEALLKRCQPVRRKEGWVSLTTEVFAED